jgi:His-Xaa-Ser system protein HxsD
MPQPIEGLPAERASADLEDGSATIRLDEDLYPLEAVYAAAYVFLDRCYVLLDREAGKLRVTLADKDGAAAAAALRDYAGEFANELLANAWRLKISAENRAVIEATTMQAIAGAMGPPSLEELSDFDFTDEPFEDPLGIAMSWEDKYAKKGPAPDDKKGGDE